MKQGISAKEMNREKKPQRLDPETKPEAVHARE